jgi:hypothetical protein
VELGEHAAAETASNISLIILNNSPEFEIFHRDIRDLSKRVRQPPIHLLRDFRC